MTQNINFQENIPSGFTKLDEMTGGWRSGDFVIIAGRPSMGKTAFALSMARNMSVDDGCGAAYFSLEMSAEQAVKRMVRIGDWKISSADEHNSFACERGLKRLNAIVPKLYDAPVYIDDTPALSELEFCEKCRRLKRENDIKVAIIDYLQLMKWSGGTGNRKLELSEIARTLKAIAGEQNIAVIAFSQLNRYEENSTNMRPVLSDLPEGGFEQYADTVLFIYRTGYYDNMDTTQAEIIVAKNRNSVLGTARLFFDKELCKFTD